MFINHVTSIYTFDFNNIIITNQKQILLIVSQLQRLQPAKDMMTSVYATGPKTNMFHSQKQWNLVCQMAARWGIQIVKKNCRFCLI